MAEIKLSIGVIGCCKLCGNRVSTGECRCWFAVDEPRPVATKHVLVWRGSWEARWRWPQ